MIDNTHDVSARSWIPSACGHSQFPLQNLPLGVFRRGSDRPRCGVAIGDHILDLSQVGSEISMPMTSVLLEPSLNALLSQPASVRRHLRALLFDLLRAGSPHQALLEPMLHRRDDCIMMLPADIGGYTDFYAGIIHATNVGRLFRPDNPLLPNYKHVPIGYHGRTSSIRPSGSTVRRPYGQLKMPDEPLPRFGPTGRLDFEVELGLWVGEGNPLGKPISIADAGEHIAGVTLLNDWSTRDVQAWEYQPLGPFLAKNFSSTVSPWLVTTEALAPFRTAHTSRGSDDPPLLPYLLDQADQENGALSIDIDVALLTGRMRKAGLAPERIGSTSALNLYWTPAQLIAHHSSNGCNLEPGDLLGTGTISSAETSGFGSLMEMTAGGADPIGLANGERRTFLEDGDEVIMTGRCIRDGFATIGFGECRATILAASPMS
ncbi:fumarylacetoacetase [Sphingobium sp.]|uniref:fumarylacetoacetase n=1 Tax=Sphingobium sp. TaxID=1912891 RepID=UPI0028BD337B|nr:fumarylacetoacetase [Sphingobium sp.]